MIESDNQRVPRAAEVGSTANSYQILAKLATGGMAEIFLARGEGVAGVERYCVLKRILQDRASDVHFVRMFLDEARLAAQLQHPNIAQVYDIGKLGDSYFFTMEYVHGETVRALLHRAQGLRRRLPLHCVLTIAAGTAAGLHHAHTRRGEGGRALGIVHRDVTPSNLMVSYEGGVKVVDFGVAKAADRGHETKSGTVKGKISYLSPEQCRGKRVDRRSDLFSLGICVWEMLTTERLYKRASDFENMNAIVTEEVPAPSSRRPDVPREIDELVARLLAKTPEERFQTAEELVEAIEDVASRTGSVLSSSSLGRFVRELFGQRPEPWLELEAQQEGEAVTVTSEPIPQELANPAGNQVNQQLASVVDLSAPRSITESLGSRAGEVPTTRVGKRPGLGFPLAAPPPTHPEVARAADPGSDPAALPPPPAVRRTPPSQAVATPPPDGEASSARATSPSPSLSPSPSPSPSPTPYPSPTPMAVSPSPTPMAVSPSPKPSPLAGTPSPTPMAGSPSPTAGSPTAGPAEPAVAASGTQPPASAASSGSFVSSLLPLPPSAASSGSFVSSPASASGPRMHASGPFVAPSSSQGALRVSSSHTAPGRRAWGLYAVIAGAALLGSIAVMIMMRSEAGAPAADLASPTNVPKPADPPPPDPAPAGAPPSAITVSPIQEPEPVAPASTEPAVADAARPAATRPPPASSKRTGSVRPASPSRSPAPAPAPRAPDRNPGSPDDEIARAYAARQYDKVVEQCGAGPVSAEHAPHCFLSACQVGNVAKARKLIVAVPAARRDQLTQTCEALGVDIKDKVDCEADPMACQR